MNVKVAVAFAVLLFALTTRASDVAVDQVNFNASYGPGVTFSMVATPCPPMPSGIQPDEWECAFSIGPSSASGWYPFESTNQVGFDVPLSDLTINWQTDAGPDGQREEVFGTFFLTVDQGSTQLFTYSSSDIGPPPIVTETNNGTKILIAFDYGITGGTIELTQTPPANVPEPSSLLLSGVGILALIGTKWQRR